MAAVTSRVNRLFSASSVPLNLENDDFGHEEHSDRKSYSRVRRLSKRLSATFKSSFTLREHDIEIDADNKNESENISASTLDLKNKPHNNNTSHVKRALGRVFSLQHFNDSDAVFRDATTPTSSSANGRHNSVIATSKHNLMMTSANHAHSSIDIRTATTNDNSIKTTDNSIKTTTSNRNSSGTDVKEPSRERLRRVFSTPEPGGHQRISSPYGKLEHYTKLEQLGEGSYATVYKGVSKRNNMFVALKEIALQEEEGIPFTAIREASLLKDLKHANIVRLHDIIPAKEHLVLVFEYLHTDLCFYLEERPYGVQPNNAKLLLFQLLRGLTYIHKKKILHRDIKPQNVLLSNRGDLKLADFGLARAKSVPSRTYTHEIVTLWYRPPDVLLGSRHYTTSLDIWGVGCIFVEMISGSPVFPGVKSARDQLSKIFKVCGTPRKDDWPMIEKCEYTHDSFEVYRKTPLAHQAPRIKTIAYAEELAENMLQLKPRERISAEAAMKHIFFADLPKSVHTLADGISIFTVKGVKMVEDHKSKPKSKSFGHFV